tara:strand:- start:12457 stop:12819 length:363 start_codon:yes stop_codon:yes gene_type:complete
VVYEEKRGASIIFPFAHKVPSIGVLIAERVVLCELFVIVEDFGLSIEDGGELHLVDGVENGVEYGVYETRFISNDSESDASALMTIKVGDLCDRHVKAMSHAIAEFFDDLSFAFEGTITG